MQIQSPPHSAWTVTRGGASRAYTVATVRERSWGWAEIFIAFQLLWGLALFVPGAQEYRLYIRALPYVLSAASLAYYFRRETGDPLPGSAKWLLVSFALLVVNLLHPATHLMAGLGQIVFQISIAAPALWMGRAIRTERRLDLFLWVLFATSLLASIVGILQVYFPERFLPPEFSVLGQTLNPDIVSSLTYTGADGRPIVRPPGLSDMPGGAAVAAMMTTTLGMTLAMRQRQAWLVRLVCLAASAVGMTVLFLTQVRSLTLLAALSLAICFVLRVRQGRATNALVGAATGVVVLSGAYLWAISVGGDAVVERFLGLLSDGALRTIDESRGLFIRYTFNELLFEFPFGAGLGRWGMMQVLFGDSTMWQAPPIHAEIQPTGWLLDGGIPLLVLYVAAIGSTLRRTYRLATDVTAGRLQDLATIFLCAQLVIAGLCLTGPVFNNQLGIVFWAIAGAVSGSVGLRRA